MKNLILPNNNEVKRWMKDVVRHSNHVEYYLSELGLGERDNERPHDLVGKYNKFDWEVLRGLSLAYRKIEGTEFGKKKFFDEQIFPSIELHRNQYHHQMWNNPNPKAKDRDLFVGVVDTVCSMLEKRVYSGDDEGHGRKKSWSIIEDVLYNKSPEYKSSATKIIFPELREITRPKLSKIKNVYDFPNIGIDSSIYDKMKIRINETAFDLERRGYSLFAIPQQI